MNQKYRLIQVERDGIRRLGVVDEPNIKLLSQFNSVYEIAQAAIERGYRLSALVRVSEVSEVVGYDGFYDGSPGWKILPSADHPLDHSHCIVSGTGLTHTASAKNRDAMHSGGEKLTDSMRMFQWGIEGGRPEEGKVGVAPEWFYKGSGAVLRGCGQPLVLPPYAEDGGEEPEIAGVYFVGPDSLPYRIGFTVGNEFSDHRFEKRNYLNLAGSKLRNCAIGPELVLDHDFQSVPGRVAVMRDGVSLWSSAIMTGEANMCHSLRNIEHHHFKYKEHRRPGDLHIHFYGADAFSFGAGVELRDGDIMEVRFDDFGRPLRNPLKVDRTANSPVTVQPL